MVKRRFVPPTIEQCEAYVAEKGYQYVNGKAFWFWYDAINWAVGKSGTKMVRWHSAMGGWEERERRKQHKANKPKLYPIRGKICSNRKCGMPAVYQTNGDYTWYFCTDHLPAKVKEQYC